MSERTRQAGENFLLQGSILAAAGLLVRLIGLLYKIPMTRILGDEGIGYYNTAYEIYNIGLILSSYSLPLAVSKLIARKEQEGKRKDAARVFNCGIFVGVVAGGFMTAFLILCSDRIASGLFNSPGSALPLRVMAPTILVFAVMGVFRGFFQGHGNMIPTSVSQVAEQLVHAGVSIWASWDFMNRYAYADNPSSYGAAGGTLGTLAGALAAFLILAVWMAKSRGRASGNWRAGERGTREGAAAPLPSRSQEAGRPRTPVSRGREGAGYGEIMGLLLLTFAPIIMSQFVYQLSGSVDNSMFGIIMGGKGLDEAQRLSLLGIYGGKYRLLTNVPVAIASSLGASMIPSIVASRVMRRRREVKEKIYLTIKFNMLLAIPCAAGMFALSSPIMRLVFGDGRKMTSDLLMLGSCAVIFFSLSTVTNAVLQGIDQMKKSVTHSAISLAVHVVLVYVMLDRLEWGVYGLVIGNVTFALGVCILNWAAIGRALRYRQEVRTTFLLPLFCSAVMGAAARLLYECLYHFIPSNTVCVLAAAAAGAAIYGWLLIAVRAVDERDLRNMPMGRLLLKFMR